MPPPPADLSDSFDTLLEKAIAHSRTSLREALELVNKALALAEQANDADQVDKGLSFRAQLHAQLGRRAEGIADAERALAGFRARGNDRGQASVLNTLAIIQEHSGHYAESFSLQSQSLEILRRFDEPAALAQVASNLGLTCTYLGDWNQALHFYKESLEAWEQLPPQTGKAILLVNLGFAHASLHEYGFAESYYREALDIFGDDDPLHTSLVYTNLAKARMENGDLEEAARLAEIARAQSEQQDDPTRRAHALDCMGSILAAKGDLKGSRTAFEQALSIYQELENRRGCAIVLIALARLTRDEPGKATRLLQEAEEMAHQSGLKPIQIDILGHFHELCKQRGAWEEACNYLERKIEAEKALLKEHTDLRLKTLRMDLKLEQSQRETELERLRSNELAEALADLEEQKRLAEEESRQKSEILHFAAHDLRNLLWGILGPAELIDSERESLTGFPEILDLVDSMNRSAHILQETLHNVLTAAAAESGEVRLTRKQVDAGSLVREAVAHWTAAAGAKQQAIERLENDANLVVFIDRSRILDCLHNLVSNAIKYSPPGSTIRVGIERSTDSIRFFVADQGPGLSEEDRQRAGRLFQRLSAKPTADERSIGVGLAVVKRFSELHGGRMEIECPPDGGSIFRIALPIS